MTEFAIKDSGERREFESGMVRDTAEGKVNFLSVRFGPMLQRWAKHLTMGREKYPDPIPGVPNWTLADGEDEYLRAKESVARHVEQWLAGERDEDHAAAIYFNLNLAEYILVKASNRGAEIDPGIGATSPSAYADPLPDTNGIGISRDIEFGAAVRSAVAACLNDNCLECFCGELDPKYQ